MLKGLKIAGIIAGYLAYCTAAGFVITVATYAGMNLAERATEWYNERKENKEA